MQPLPTNSLTCHIREHPSHLCRQVLRGSSHQADQRLRRALHAHHLPHLAPRALEHVGERPGSGGAGRQRRVAVVCASGRAWEGSSLDVPPKPLPVGPASCSSTAPQPSQQSSPAPRSSALAAPMMRRDSGGMAPLATSVWRKSKSSAAMLPAANSQCNITERCNAPACTRVHTSRPGLTMHGQQHADAPSAHAHCSATGRPEPPPA